MQRAAVLVFAAVLGAGSLPLFIGGDSLRDVLVLGLIGAAAGLAGGATFWTVGQFRLLTPSR
jgi:hypothetical protein